MTNLYPPSILGKPKAHARPEFVPSESFKRTMAALNNPLLRAGPPIRLAAAACMGCTLADLCRDMRADCARNLADIEARHG